MKTIAIILTVLGSQSAGLLAQSSATIYTGPTATGAFTAAHPAATQVAVDQSGVRFREGNRITLLTGPGLVYVESGQWHVTAPRIDAAAGNTGWTLKGTGLPVSLVDAGSTQKRLQVGSGTAILDWTLTNVRYSSANGFLFDSDGLTWTLALYATSVSMKATVAAQQGKKTYSFAYNTKGAAVTVDAKGNLVTGGSIVTTKAAIVGADKKIYACGGWSAAAGVASFTCDDSALPKAAYPYVLDPVVYGTGISGYTCDGTDGGGTCYGGAYHATFPVNLPAGATVSAVTLTEPDSWCMWGDCTVTTYFSTPSGNVQYPSQHLDWFNLQNSSVTWHYEPNCSMCTTAIVEGGYLSITYDAQAAAPSFTPAGGNYTSAVIVSLSSSSSGVTIRYTTDGSTPSEYVGTIYSGVFMVSSTSTVKAIAYGSAYTDSSVSQATYTITGMVADPQFSPGSGTYTSPPQVTITTATPGASIRYTTDGSTPTSTFGTPYTGAFTLAASATVKAIGYKSGWADSYVRQATYTVTGTVATPTVSPIGGMYTFLPRVTLATATSGASIRYTTDGSTPTSAYGTVYTGPFTLNSAATVKAMAYLSGWADSAVATAVYTVQSGSDLAAGKAASQSSTLDGNSVASHAADGNTDGNYSHGSITHTNADAYAWWQVDLGFTASVSSIVVWNRTDCCGSRLSNYWVFVSDTPFGPGDTPATLQGRAGTWSSHQTVMPNPTATVAAGGALGRYVRVQLAGTDYLSLAEVQVYGSGNVAAGQAATQSSTLDSNTVASHAVDGNTDGNYAHGSITHTLNDAYPWWQVDLGASGQVSSVRIWNRTDCCGSRLSNYWVFVSDTPFGPSDTPATLQGRAGTWSSHQTTMPNPSATITVGARGRYVRVQLAQSDYLSLAEVEIFDSLIPAVVSMTPASGAGPGGTFTATYSDGNGYADIDSVATIIGDAVRMDNSCMAIYWPGNNQIVLVNDAGTAWLGPVTRGTPGTLSNSQCILDAGATTVSSTGSTLTVNYAVTFQPGFSGARNLYAEVNGHQATSGWQTMGTWTVMSNYAPTPVSVAPDSGSGLAQRFTFTFTHPIDAAWIYDASIYFGATEANGCYLYFQRGGNPAQYQWYDGLWLATDADNNNWLPEMVVGTGSPQENSQCRVNPATSTAVRNGTTLTLTVDITFKTAFAGARDIHMLATDGTLYSDWVTRGTWTVTSASAPVPVSVTPSYGSGTSQTFAAQYSDALGYGDITQALLSVGGTAGAANTCTAKWTSAAGFCLYNDAGTTCVPPSGGTVSNSQCTLNASQSSATGSGNTRTVNFALSFNSSFAGTANVYAEAASAGAPNPVWQTMGTWTVPSPPAQSLTGDNGTRRIGVRPRGVYWGSASENIDVRSGNLNLTLPLVHAQGRAGSGATFALSYNSQIWSGTGPLGKDVGYGWGWKLMAGSIAPAGGGGYIYTDATGAEYSLNVNTNGVWTSTEGVYVSYDAAATRLYFPSGVYWAMGCVSAAGEADAGTRYPTLIEDTNGNQILVHYYDAAWNWNGNASARISIIEDVRGSGEPAGASYQFSYTNGHLSGIAGVGPEGYSFTYTTTTLQSPLTYTGYGSATLPAVVTSTVTGQSTQLLYEVPGYAEVTRMITPAGGELRWYFGTLTYSSGSVAQREVTKRSLVTAAGGVVYDFPIAHEGTALANVVAGQTTINDPAGGQKAWFFQTTGNGTGLVTAAEERLRAGVSTSGRRRDFTWTQDGNGVAYLGAIVTTEDVGTVNQVQKKATQTLDGWGNVTQSQTFDYGNLVSPARNYLFTYLADANYTSRYIRDRLLTATLNGTVLAANWYDVTDAGHTCGGGFGVSGPQDPSQAQDPFDPTPPVDLKYHDAAYGVGFLYRGNAVWMSRPSGLTCVQPQVTGVAAKTFDGVRVRRTTPSAATNYTLPGTLSVNDNANLVTRIGYDASFQVTSVTGVNGDSIHTEYDGAGRPTSMTTADGWDPLPWNWHSTTYTYTATTQTATLGSRWKRTTIDGFGRVIKVENGHDTTTESQVESEYGPCGGCSPLGKLKRTSQPHAPGVQAKWTTYGYDGMGRTLSVTAPDGSVTAYAYAGNTVTVVDAAGKWKRSTTDAFGNLVKVEEPNPGGGANYVTTYTYTVLNQLAQVTMPRPVGSNVVTQTRTFTYSGSLLMSATNPENGTVNYYYNADQRIEHRVDAKGQKTAWEYDGSGRVVVVRHYPNGVTEDAAQRVTYTYDLQGLVPGYTEYGSGRLAAVEFTAGGSGGKAMRYVYKYNRAGRVTGRKMEVSTGPGWYDIDQAYTYDNEGRVTQMTHPDGGVYNYGFDAMGRVNAMTQGQTTVASAVYGAAGQMVSMQYLGMGETRVYNDLLQMTRLTASDSNGTQLDMEYRYTAARNNGRIAQAKDWVSGEEVSYTYDTLNRLTTAATTDATWGLAFTYDGFGNLTDRVVTKGSAPAGPVATDAATNRLIGKPYDANGNLLDQGYVYDVENRLVGDGGSGTTYGYDDGGKRVWKAWGVRGVNYGAEVTVWGLNGKRLATYAWATFNQGCQCDVYGLAGSNVYFGGKLIKAAGQAVVLDRLGSVRWKGNGERYHYFPYGEEYGSDSGPSQGNGKEKFGTYFRDANGLDYADQRYYGAGTGRFLTPDPLMAVDRREPRTWNAYSYAYADPITYYDPEGGIGHCPDGTHTGPDAHSCVPDSSPTSSPPGTTFPLPQPEHVDVPEEGPVDAPPFDPRTLLPGMRGRAIDGAIALLNPINFDCWQLFNVGGSGFDPDQLLIKLAAGNTPYGSIQYGTITDPREAANTVSQLNAFGSDPIVGALITLNNSVGSLWFSTSDDDRTMTILHELAHAYGYIYGKGTSMLEDENVPGLTAEQRGEISHRNQEQVRSKCTPH